MVLVMGYRPWERGAASLFRAGGPVLRAARRFPGTTIEKHGRLRYDGRVHEDVERVLIDEGVIEKRLDAMADRILEEFRGMEFVVVVILKGALVFTADLLRRMPVPLEIECINVASYHGETESSGKVDFLDRKLPDVGGRSVLLVDDILDTGRTLHAVRGHLLEHAAAKVRTCVLLTKDKPRAADVEADYSGFDIGDEFVVGYGLDFRGRYRNLPYIGVLKEEVIDL